MSARNDGVWRASLPICARVSHTFFVSRITYALNAGRFTSTNESRRPLMTQRMRSRLTRTWSIRAATVTFIALTVLLPTAPSAVSRWCSWNVFTAAWSGSSSTSLTLSLAASSSPVAARRVLTAVTRGSEAPGFTVGPGGTVGQPPFAASCR